LGDLERRYARYVQRRYVYEATTTILTPKINFIK